MLFRAVADIDLLLSRIVGLALDFGAGGEVHPVALIYILWLLYRSVHGQVEVIVPFR